MRLPTSQGGKRDVTYGHQEGDEQMLVFAVPSPCVPCLPAVP